MATLFLVGRIRIVVYSNDHGPPHVHAVGEGHAKFELGTTASNVRLIECDGMSRRDLRRIAEHIVARHGECLEGWRKHRGR